LKEMHLGVRGRVQGVFFRKNSKRIADSLGLGGTVRNCDDGSVEIFVQGSVGKLKEFVIRIRKSPGASKVEDVRGEVVEVSKKFDSFEIIYERNIFADKKKAFGNLGKRIFG